MLSVILTVSTPTALVHQYVRTSLQMISPEDVARSTNGKSHHFILKVKISSERRILIQRKQSRLQTYTSRQDGNRQHQLRIIPFYVYMYQVCWSVPWLLDTQTRYNVYSTDISALMIIRAATLRQKLNIILRFSRLLLLGVRILQDHGRSGDE